jgi:hypothetical protein
MKLLHTGEGQLEALPGIGQGRVSALDQSIYPLLVSLARASAPWHAVQLLGAEELHRFARNTNRWILDVVRAY